MSIDLDVKDDGIAVITINRPDKRNALDAEHYQALSEAWTRVRDDDALRVAIITGAGDKVFSAGADLKSWIGRTAPMSDMWQTQKGMLLNRGLEVWKPVIAAVNGHCLAGGMTLLLATDIRVAVPHATFSLAEVKRGIIASNAPLAVQACKELALRAPELGLAAGLRMEQFVNRALLSTSDAKEGVLAF